MKELPTELQNILNQYNQTSHLSPTQSQSNKQDISFEPDEVPTHTIEMKVYSFDVLGSKLYILTKSDHLPYIQDYINTINSGKPDKDMVIRKYAIEYQKMSESLLNRIELDLKSILDAQKRDQKINDILDGDL